MIVGITGMKNAGKSTVATFLKNACGFRSIAFADPIKRALAAAYGVDIKVFYDQDTKEHALPELLGKSPRVLMQTLGTDWGRDMISESLWVDLSAREMARYAAGGHSIVVSDVRRDNEAEAVLAAGGEVWHVVGPHGIPDDHASEEGISGEYVSSILVNDGSKAQLYSRIGGLLEHRARRPDPHTVIEQLSLI